MKKFFILLAVVFVIASITVNIFALPPEPKDPPEPKEPKNGGTQLGGDQPSGGILLDLAKNWQLMAIFAIAVSVLLVATAYGIGIAFEIPEIKAWAGNELAQIFTNAIIVVLIVATISLLEVLVTSSIVASGLIIPSCNAAATKYNSCLQSATTTYLEQYSTAVKDLALSVLKNNVNAAAWANRRLGIQCITILCVQIGTSFTGTGYLILDQDTYAIIFEYAVNLLSSFETQKFFVTEVAFRFGPVLLALGIILRCFFATRKMGGLLMAVAIGIQFFLPAMYLFDWMTLDMVINGDKGFATEQNMCPSECLLSPPFAYTQSGQKLDSVSSVYDFVGQDNEQLAQKLIEGKTDQATLQLNDSKGNPITETIYSCYSAANSTQCPVLCRERPYPYSIPSCSNTTAGIPQKCGLLPEQCVVVRYVPPARVEPKQAAMCPSYCRVVPPLKINCDVGQCLNSRPDCRSTLISDPTYRPSLPNGYDEKQVQRCDLAKDCPADMTNAKNSCVFGLPKTGSCDEKLCLNCPAPCRLINGDPSKMPTECKQFEAACNSCAQECKIDINNIKTISAGTNYCTSCAPEKRIIASFDGIDTAEQANYSSNGCEYTACPSEYRLTIPANACDGCLLADEEATYSPPISVRCDQLCKPSNKNPVKQSGDYSQIDADGLVGKTEIKEVSKIMVPGYLLPLINIALTLIFIKGLSEKLGGDIEIPGMSKIF